METVKLSAEFRENKGKGGARKLRAKGLIPAIIYSSGIDSRLLSVNARIFKNLHDKGLNENRFLHLSFEKEDITKDALLKEIQVDPVSDEVIHIDFQEVDLSKPMDIEVPLRIINEDKCKGLIEVGALLQIHARSVNVHALPLLVPEEIDLDVKDLNIGDILMIKDMPVIDGLRYIDESDKKVVSLIIMKKEVEVIPEKEAVEGAEVKEGAEKKEGEAPAKEEKSGSSSSKGEKE